MQSGFSESVVKDTFFKKVMMKGKGLYGSSQ